MELTMLLSKMLVRTNFGLALFRIEADQQQNHAFSLSSGSSVIPSLFSNSRTLRINSGNC